MLSVSLNAGVHFVTEVYVNIHAEIIVSLDGFLFLPLVPAGLCSRILL